MKRYCGGNSIGRVTAFQAVGCGFESRPPLKMEGKFFVYVLFSEKFNKYYVGSTKDLLKRIEHHNSSKARWTRKYQPWRLVHSEEFESRGSAIIREREIKMSKNISRYVNQ